MGREILCRCVVYIERVELELRGGKRKILVGRVYEWNWSEEEEIADLQGGVNGD